MRKLVVSVSSPDALEPVPGQSAIDIWCKAAEADYALCRRFADAFDAKLSRSLRSQRVGWEREQKPVYGILIPDPLLSSASAELLRQALATEVFDVRYSVVPHRVNALGDYEHTPTGYEFTLSAHGPHSPLAGTRRQISDCWVK